MNLYSLAYASQATRKFSEADLKELADRAAVKNQNLRVTGYLCFQKDIFFQYLEGPTDAVTELMAQIAADDRHDVVNQIDLGTIESRKFPDWSMRYVSPAGLKMIHLKDVLQHVLLNMTEAAYGRTRLRELIHPMVAKIAERQAMLVSRFD